MKYASIVTPAAAAHGVPLSWAYAVLGAESGDVRTFTFNDVIAPTWEDKVKEYSWGPMQILTSTARAMGFTGNELELARPEVSIPLAVKYVATLRARYGADLRRVYSAYNSGNPDAWQTSSQVATNVNRAMTWFRHFQPKPIVAGVLAIVVLVLGLSVTAKRKSRRRS